MYLAQTKRPRVACDNGRMNPWENPKWQALNHEAAIAAEQIAIGVTALGKANYAQPAYHGQAFFALSAGFERAAKLAIAVDYALDHGGKYPDAAHFKKYGHDLKKLLSAVEEIAIRRSISDDWNRLPRAPIHDGIVDTLSDFASNVTRYYNLESLSGATNRTDDPLAAWNRRVTAPVLAAHFKERQRSSAERNARAGQAMHGGHIAVHHHSETGEGINTFYDGSMETAATRVARRWEQLYVLQIARFVSAVVGELGRIAQFARREEVPYLAEFFAIFYNPDDYLRSRRTWSIYRR